MCRTVKQTSYANSCGHQVTTSLGESFFCLFYPHKPEEYHIVTTMYYEAPEGQTCYECEIKADAYAKGLKGAERHKYVADEYKKSRELKQKENAAKDIAAVKKTQEVQFTKQQIADMNEDALVNVEWYIHHGIKKGGLRLSEKIILLKTIVQMPNFIDRKSLVRLFGSHISWNWKDEKKPYWKGVPSDHCASFRAIARHAGFPKTLEEGLSRRRPIVTKATPELELGARGSKPKAPATKAPAAEAPEAKAPTAKAPEAWKTPAAKEPVAWKAPAATAPAAKAPEAKKEVAK
ncbi:hypothetical protein F4806DRAFT_323012 [Annulohypoxylon nitens]|nr:hypothetical protein F4806DRAFT_323012 [Annulohypoxylon nitens]